MASGRMEFHAQSIMQHANFSFALPNDAEMTEVRNHKHYERPTKSLLLLHGLTGTDTDWMFGGLAQEMARQYNLAIFMPTTGNSFYLDKGYVGGNFGQFVGEELPEYINKVFGYFSNREDSMIGGLSMGGYGAIHTAFAFPERFSECIALSSAIHLEDIAGKKASARSLMPVEMLTDVFGDLSKLMESDKNPKVQFAKLKKEGRKIPRLYMAIGTEDAPALYNANTDFRDFLQRENADFFFEDGPGRHDWAFWNAYLDRGLKWVLG
ncbi:hypothetical protein BXO88_09165 [Oribacterium sp. C9]|uniref:alpha/beta hydrolase n=1 Tax=Oribacterium sp. C9 TaxID=1943579 RepID=UPI00098E9A01|nr:alpha/beta hydrolase-fold protein [Oribacterium sp. C9]OON85999.1 hypothetical protein BXO88_09165 [Oribacterium sp. C9]